MRSFCRAVVLNVLDYNFCCADTFLLTIETMLNRAESLAHDEWMRFRHDIARFKCFW